MASTGELLEEEAEAPVVLPSPVAHATEGRPSTTLIRARPGWHRVDFRELWRYREVLYTLVWRDVKVQYKQTALGVGWAVLQPLLTMLVFSVFLGRVASRPDLGVPYPLFVFAGLVPWLFLSGTIAKASDSVLANQALVTKIYFPRLLVPLSAMGVGLVDLAVSLLLLLGMALVCGFVPGPRLLLLPLSVASLVATGLGVGSLLAAVIVWYRDARRLMPLMLQAWMFATPTIYLQVGMAAGIKTQALMILNPAVGAIDNFRRALLGQPIDPVGLGVSLTTSFALLVMGVLVFERSERRFSDVI